ncbi:MAG: hypothetical protein IPN13_12400 [Bacteroidetes bacterium]|nr:hypothetical protein [Bacteroidota bacterium]
MGSFALAFHDWNEACKRFVTRCKALNIAYTTPMIGTMILPDGKHRMHEAWYE